MSSIYYPPFSYYSKRKIDGTSRHRLSLSSRPVPDKRNDSSVTFGSEHGPQSVRFRFTCLRVLRKSRAREVVDFDLYATSDVGDHGCRQLASFPVWSVQHAALAPVFVFRSSAPSIVSCILVRGAVHGEFAVVAASSQLAPGLVPVPRPIAPGQPGVINIVHSLCAFTTIAGPDSFKYAYA